MDIQKVKKTLHLIEMDACVAQMAIGPDERDRDWCKEHLEHIKRNLEKVETELAS